MSVSLLYSRLKPFTGREHILVNDQNVSDIITSLVKTHSQYTGEYDKICAPFFATNSLKIGSKIWHFIKKNIKYVIEADERQLLKSPSAILYTGSTTGSDCKNYSLFTGGILDALNRKGAKVNWCYRFASYKLDDKIPHHVFVVINPDTENEIWVDAVLPSYNLKKQYFYKTDRKVKNMTLIAMSGVTYEGLGKTKKPRPAKAAKKAKRQAKKATKKAAAPAKKAARKAKFKKVLNKIKSVKKIVLKFDPLSATARNMFLLLVKLNFRSLATNLKTGIAKDAAKFKKFWEATGGKFAVLQKQVEIGSKKKRLGAMSGTINTSVGVVQVAAAALAATPLLIKICNLFKSVGINPGNLMDAAKSGLNAIAKKKIDNIKDSAESGEDTGEDGAVNFDGGGGDSGDGGGGSSYPSSSNGGGGSSSDGGNSGGEEGEEGGEGGLMGFIKKNKVLVGIGVLGIGYALTKK